MPAGLSGFTIEDNRFLNYILLQTIKKLKNVHPITKELKFKIQWNLERMYDTYRRYYLHLASYEGENILHSSYAFLFKGFISKLCEKRWKQCDLQLRKRKSLEYIIGWMDFTNPCFEKKGLSLEKQKEAIQQIHNIFLPDEIFNFCFKVFIEAYLQICFKTAQELTGLKLLQAYGKVWWKFLKSTLDFHWERTIIAANCAPREEYLSCWDPDVIEIALSAWMRAFLNGTNSKIFLAIREIIQRELDEGIDLMQKVPYGVINSYTNFGFLDGSLIPNTKPTPLAYNNFYIWHLYLFPMVLNNPTFHQFMRIQLLNYTQEEITQLIQLLKKNSIRFHIRGDITFEAPPEDSNMVDRRKRQNAECCKRYQEKKRQKLLQLNQALSEERLKNADLRIELYLTEMEIQNLKLEHQH